MPWYICLCACLTVSPSFLPLYVSLWCTTSHCFCYHLPLCVYMCMFICVCDELAGNWLLNGATAAMRDKIATRETERPIHLLSANQPSKTTGPFIKPPLTTCRVTHTQFDSCVSLSTRHFWQAFRVKVCNISKKFPVFSHWPAKHSSLTRC